MTPTILAMDAFETCFCRRMADRFCFYLLALNKIRINLVFPVIFGYLKTVTPTQGTGLEGAGRNAQINRRCHAVARKGQKRVLFYAFVTLYRDHFIDGMRNVMTFLFICRAVAGET